MALKLKKGQGDNKETPKANAEKTALKNKATLKAAAEKTAGKQDKKKETLKDANVAVIASKALTEVKYNYPADKITVADRKAFRSEIRRKLASFTKKIAALREQDTKEAKALLKEAIAGYNEVVKVRKDLSPLKN